MSDPITRTRLATMSPMDAAALWLVQRDGGRPAEAGLFEEWLQESEANRAAWEAAEYSWRLFDDADDPDLLALREAALADRPAPRWHDVRQQWRPAAAAVLVAMVASGIQFSRRPVARSDRIAPQAVFAAPADADRSFALADGTKMTLGRSAQARVTLAGDRRQVILDRGNVTLAVMHDTARPFSVSALDRTIIDVGTRFQVALEDGAMRVALYEGSVSVRGGASEVILRPGEQLVARPGRRDVVTRIAAVGGQTRQVEFNDVALSTAVETINQGSMAKLVVADPRIAALRVSGQFRAGDAERFARTVSVLLSLRVVRISPNRIELRRGR